MVELTVLIPAYNEGLRMRYGVLDPVLKFLKDQYRDWQLLIVDDGSTDETSLIARSYGDVISTPHRGKAAAIIRGALAAQGQYTLICDMDQSTPITELGLFRPEPGVMLYGQRWLFRDQPIQRKIMTWGQLVARSILIPQLGFVDTQCGFKLWYTQDLINVINHLVVYADHRLKNGTQANVNSGFDVECMLVARSLGIMLVGVPVIWKHIKTGRVQLIRDSKRGLSDLLNIWLANLEGAYDYHAVLAG